MAVLSIDIQLINACLHQDRAAQRQLYEQLLPYLNVICHRYLHDLSHQQDVLQETFIRIFRHLAQYDVQRASFKTWTTKIAINCCLQQNQKQQTTDELIVPLHEQRIDPAILYQLSDQALIQWLRRMPRSYYDVFNLHTIEGFAHPEIAELLAISEEVSRQRLSRAKAWLRKHLPASFHPSVHTKYC